jgi:hypothetical protein
MPTAYFRLTSIRKTDAEVVCARASEVHGYDGYVFGYSGVDLGLLCNDWSAAVRVLAPSREQNLVSVWSHGCAPQLYGIRRTR